MPGFKTTYEANLILDLTHGGVAYTPVATWYYALFTVAPTISGGGTEVAGGSYGRIGLTNNLTNYPSASGGSKKNATAITFAAPTADWGVCVGIGQFDASSSGNLRYYEPFATPITILNGASALVLPINSGTFTEA